MAGTNFLRKLTTKGILGGVVSKVVDMSTMKEGDSVWLYDLYGTVTAANLEESDLGNYTRFKGRFEAVNKDGAIFTSKAAILPALADEMFGDEIRDALAQEGTDSLDLAVRVGAKKADNHNGYEYTVEPIVAVQTSDHLAHLRDQTKAKEALADQSKGKAKAKGAESDG